MQGGSRKTWCAERAGQKQRLHLVKPMSVRGNDIEVPGILPVLLGMHEDGVTGIGTWVIGDDKSWLGAQHQHVHKCVQTSRF